MGVEPGYIEGTIVCGAYDPCGCATWLDVKQPDHTIVRLLPAICVGWPTQVKIRAHVRVNSDDGGGTWVDEIEVTGIEVEQ
jgi:hypothetical protein